MNWFERYGIPGIYFVLLLAVFYWIIFGDLPTQYDSLAVFGVLLSASMPLGYILVIFSQVLYYTIPLWQVHSKAWRKATNEEKEKKEWWVETEATILGRLRCPNNQVDRNRWIQDWFMKRFDVLTINSALMLATIVGWVLGLLGLLFMRPTGRDVNSRYLLVFGMISLFIFLILFRSNYVLTKQARRIATEYYTHLGNKNKATSPNSG